MVVYNANRKISDYHEFKESGPNDCADDRQPEIAIWPPKLKVRMSIYISSIDISTSVWGPYCCFRLSVVVAIIWEHLFQLAVVGKLHFASTVTTILVLYLICNIRQHDHGISPVLENSTRV